MGNSISLYCGNLEEIVAQLRAFDDEIEADEDHELPFPNQLEDGDDSDDPLQDLADLMDGKESELSPAARAFLSSFLWDWTGGEPISDVAVDFDEVGVNALIGPDTLRKMDLDTIEVDTLAATLFTPSDRWESADELAEYLALWLNAYMGACDAEEGVALKVWV